MMPIAMRFPAMLMLPLLVATTNGQVTETLFDALIPSACVSLELNSAGFCSVQQSCASRCFGQDTSGSSTASAFSLDSDGLANFYIPSVAETCAEFEDPICPAVRCCPACKDELKALYRCIIREGNYDKNFPFTISNYCNLDCKNWTPPDRPVITPPPTAPPTAAPVVTNQTDSNTTDVVDTDPPVTNATDSNATDSNTTNVTATDPPVLTKPSSNTTDAVVSRTEPPVEIDVGTDYNETDWNETDWNETDWEDEEEEEEDDAEDETAQAASNLIQAMAMAP